MSLGVSVAGNIKKQIIQKISALPDIAKVYGYDEVNFTQFPVAFVKAIGQQGEFWTNASNMRIYSYRVLVLWPLGQDLKSQTDDRLQVAIENVDEVVDEIINAVDSDYVLGNYAAVLFVDAADSIYQEYDYEGGKAYGAEITLKVHSEYFV